MGSDVDWREWSEFAKTTDGKKLDWCWLWVVQMIGYTELYLVGGLEHGFYFPIYILGMSSSQLTHNFQRGRWLNHQPDTV